MSVSPELREFVLTLPLDVRQELAKCEGPFWLASRYSTGNVHVLCRESGYADERDAWLPVSPIAIALHAAKLAGADTVALEMRDGSMVLEIRFPMHPILRGKRLPVGADDDNDPTGHRAAIALLQKVMAEKVTP